MCVCVGGSGVQTVEVQGRWELFIVAAPVKFPFIRLSLAEHATGSIIILIFFT